MPAITPYIMEYGLNVYIIFSQLLILLPLLLWLLVLQQSDNSKVRFIKDQGRNCWPLYLNVAGWVTKFKLIIGNLVMVPGKYYLTWIKPSKPASLFKFAWNWIILVCQFSISECKDLKFFRDEASWAQHWFAWILKSSHGNCKLGWVFLVLFLPDGFWWLCYSMTSEYFLKIKTPLGYKRRAKNQVN